MTRDDRLEMGWARQAVVLASLLVGSLPVAPARAAETVEQWGVYEIEMKGPTENNPFVDIRFSAVFTNGSRSIEVGGFYDGDGVYRVRFMPEQTGVWRYETRSNRWPLSRRTGSFTATAPKGLNHGPVRVHNTYHFAYADGTTFRPLGTTCYRDVWRKPVVYDEVKYEGNENARWGQLTAQEMVHRMWSGAVAGTYVQHGECYLHANDTWLSYGGVLRGESPTRIAFLRRALEDGPAGGIDPIDKWQDWNMAGRPGEYYLLYFGHETPTSWPFVLFREGLQDGMEFKAEVIDTWAMTVAPVAPSGMGWG